MNRLHLYVLSAVLTLFGVLLFSYKTMILDFPLTPGRLTQVWKIEAHVSFLTHNRPIKVQLSIPKQDAQWQLVDENFISRDFGFHVERETDNRKAIWTARKVTGKQNLFYTATVKPAQSDPIGPPPKVNPTSWPESTRVVAESILTSAMDRSTDTETLVIELLKMTMQASTRSNAIEPLFGKNETYDKKAKTVTDLLAFKAIPARTVHGIALNDGNTAPMVHWLEVFYEKQWHPFTLQSAEKGVPDNYLAWWRGNGPIVVSTGATELKVKLSAAASRIGALQAAVDAGRKKHPFFETFSLFGLPLSTQSVYRILLMVPLGALILVILRNMVGMHTFGTFMPILIALAFRETRLVWGIILFVVMISMGLTVRLYLERLKLLVVPRLAAMLSVVVLLMINFSMITHHLGIQMGLSVALFPMVIMTMAIERMSVIWDESGPSEAFRQGVGTLLVSAIIYLVMNISLVEHLMFVFPELLLVVLSGILLMGRYTGYRLTELARFKALVDHVK